MPYPKTPEKLRHFLPKIREDPEIGEDLERTGTRMSVVVSELEARAEEIWHRASPQIQGYDNVVQSVDTASQEYELRLPREPRWLGIFRMSGQALAVVAVLAVAAGVGIGFWKGWGFLTNRLFLSVVLEIVLVAPFPIILYFLRRRGFVRHRADVEAAATKELGLDTANARLQAALAAADSAVEQTVFATTRAFLESRKGRSFGQQLPPTKPDGLAQVRNSEYDIATESRQRVRRLIETLQGASIGISGPRGAGKTTLMWSVYETGNAKEDVLSVFTSAPVQYEARDFILHLFSGVCLRIIEKQIGRETVSTAWETLPESRTPAPNPFVHISSLGPVLLSAGVLLLSLGVSVAILKMNAAPAQPAAPAAAQGGKAAALSGVERFMKALDLAPAPLIEWGAILGFVGLGLFYQHEYDRRRRPLARGRVAEDRLDALGTEARRLLSAIRFQQSYTSGWSGSFKLPVALEAGVKREESWSERQQTLPEIVTEFCEFLARATSPEAPYKKVIICIDELDKLESDEAAQRFLNGIKSIFNQPRCFYLISVSENAMSNFERRGLPFRDAFDSSFDEVVYIDYLDLDASKRLLARRVLNIPHPFLCFCHSISGGLPRDLVRICRSLFEFRDQLPNENALAGICAKVVRSDIESKLRAMNIAAQRLASSREVIQFREFSSLKEINDAGAAWAAIEKLEPFLGTLASDEGDGDDKQNLAALATETTVFLYFAVTMLELFTILDEPLWLRGEDQDLFDQLARLRRELARNQVVASKALANTRTSFGLSARPPKNVSAVVGG